MMDWVIGIVWLMPFPYCLLAFTGWVLAQRRRIIDPSLMIIQITTIGNHDVVNQLIQTLRAYQLELPLTLWVVTEPGQESGYVGADEVLVVPADFRCKATHKARALEYSRRVREARGLVSDAFKVLFLDDDSIPTRAYVVKAFHADYDICEGMVVPRNNYGSLLSHIDDLRTVNCLCICAFFQMIGRPVWVHGEGMCVRTSAEQVVTWDHAIFASEDLVFGHLAAARNLHWGFIRERILITSPWNVHDLVRQRRRWLWGHIEAIQHILPARSTATIVSAHLLGIVVYPLSIAGIGIDLNGYLPFGLGVRIAMGLSLVLWLGVFAYAGWVNSGGRPLQSLLSAVLLWISSGATLLLLLVCLAMGNPHQFEVIAKARPSKV